MKLSKTVVAVGATLALAACSDQSPVTGRAPEAAPLHSAGAGAIEGSYVVVLEEGADPRSVAAVAGVSPRYVYTAAVNGFAATLNAGQLNALQHNPNVAYVEQDQAYEATATQSGATWGIDRIDQRSRPLSGTYTYTTTASTVYAYVIDTGIYASHSQFGGRASNVYDALGGNGNDCNGHGTHVAGTIGSSTYGVAKAVRLRGLRVLDCNGSGSTSGIIAAIDWLRVNRTNPAVANLSLGGGYSSTLNTAINNPNNNAKFNVGIMLLNDKGQVWVGRRIDRTDEAWQMPQGGIDPGEEPWDTALRELDDPGAQVGVELSDVTLRLGQAQLLHREEQVPRDDEHGRGQHVGRFMGDGARDEKLRAKVRDVVAELDSIIEGVR